MYSLMLDSSYKDLGVGIAKDNVVIENINYECFQRQSELMIVEIENALKRNNINPKEINEVLVALGPGSYTGVRIALTIAKVYCYALKIPCYAFSSLKVLQNYSKPSICLINARSSRSYVGVYDKNNCLIPDQVMKNEDVIKYIENHNNLKDTNILWIEELGVNEKYRRQGIGSRLIKEVRNIARKEGCSRVELNCWCFNENAIKFYKKIGMKEQRINMEI